MISFKGRQFPKHSILHAVYFYLRYSVSLRELEAQSRKRPTAISWRMDETYIKVRGKWTYLYRAVDRASKTLDFMRSERRNTAVATRVFAKAPASSGMPLRIVIDKSGANGAGINEVYKILKRFGCPAKITTVKFKYLNNTIEPPLGDGCAFTCRSMDHRFIKRRTRPMLGFSHAQGHRSGSDDPQETV